MTDREIHGNIREIDINPVIVHESGCTIVDALIVPAGREEISVGAAHGREKP